MTITSRPTCSDSRTARRSSTVSGWRRSSIIPAVQIAAPMSFIGHIWIIADRNIKPGEELTYDYSLYDGDGDAPCRCGAPGCRGTMYDEDELKKARKKKKEAGKK